MEIPPLKTTIWHRFVSKRVLVHLIFLFIYIASYFGSCYFVYWIGHNHADTDCINEEIERIEKMNEGLRDFGVQIYVGEEA